MMKKVLKGDFGIDIGALVKMKVEQKKKQIEKSNSTKEEIYNNKSTRDNQGQKKLKKIGKSKILTEIAVLIKVNNRYNIFCRL